MREAVKRKRTQKEILEDGKIGPLDLAGLGDRYGLAARTMKNYNSEDRIDAPDGYVSGAPFWWASTGDKWHAKRPGRGFWGARAGAKVTW